MTCILQWWLSGIEEADPNDDHFLVVRAEQGGSCILFTFGQDKIGGTDARWDALARFNRCEQLAARAP